MNLIICCTPFQVLIAEKIIDMYPNENFIFKMIVLVDNDKNRFYFKKLSKKVLDAEYIFVNKRKYLVECIHLKIKGSKVKGINRIFLANIDEGHIHVQLYCSSLFHNSSILLESFDDGIGNIVPTSHLYITDKKKMRALMKRLIKFFLGSSINILSIKKRLSVHYSIYKDKKNIIDNVKYINLFGNYTLVNEKESEYKYCVDNKKVILLGQPLYTIDNLIFDEKDYVDLVKKVCDNFCIDAYFPHPLEYIKVQGVDYIDTLYIAEDYFFNQVVDGKKYIVYTFFSGVALTLSISNNIQVVSILSESLKKLKGIEIGYELMLSNNIEVVLI